MDTSRGHDTWGTGPCGGGCGCQPPGVATVTKILSWQGPGGFVGLQDFVVVGGW